MEQISVSEKKFRKELHSGTSSLILLSVMAQAEEPLYGYQIAKMLNEYGGNALILKQGSLYPVLRSMAGMELLDSHVNPSVSGPPRRYYQITEKGREALKKWKGIWMETVKFIDEIIGGDNV